MDRTMNRFNWMSIVILMALSLVFISCAHAKPPQPGPDFVWVEAHKTPGGDTVPGHWKYVGPPVEGKTWIPGHYNAQGKWVEGHWQAAPPSRKGAVWVPGHHGPGGRWIPGHWR